jgi:hypothetical protein
VKEKIKFIQRILNLIADLNIQGAELVNTWGSEKRLQYLSGIALESVCCSEVLCCVDSS